MSFFTRKCAFANQKMPPTTPQAVRSIQTKISSLKLHLIPFSTGALAQTVRRLASSVIYTRPPSKPSPKPLGRIYSQVKENIFSIFEK